MSKHNPIPRDYPVTPLRTLESRQRAMKLATCGHCDLSWDDGYVTSMTPAPSGRCPFESFHVYTPQMQLTISETTDDTDSMILCLERIVELLREGYTSGYEPSWELKEIQT